MATPSYAATSRRLFLSSSSACFSDIPPASTLDEDDERSNPATDPFLFFLLEERERERGASGAGGVSIGGEEGSAVLGDDGEGTEGDTVTKEAEEEEEE